MRHSCFRMIGVAAGLWFVLAGGGAAQNMPIDQRLYRTESDLFIVIHQESLAERVPDLVRECELAHAVLAPIFRWTPREKTVVLFHDGADEHNGWATTIPRPHLAFYAAGPSPSSIYEPGGYLRSTLWHEYTHILMMDAKHGFGDILGRVFGRFLPVGGDPLSTLISLWALPPGLLAPEWFLEGAAIWSETEFTRQGRGRQSYADMVMRMAAADDRALTPDQWNLAHPEWPFGDAAYLWGARAMQHAQEQDAQAPHRNVVGELADSVNHSVLWFFDDQARPVTGQSFADIAHGALQAEIDYQRERLAELRRRPVTPLDRRTPERLQVTQPRFTADGRAIVFAGSREAGRDVLYRHDLDTGDIRPIPSARVQAGLSRLAPDPARRRFLYTRLNIEGRDRYRTELREWNPATGRTRRITAAGRYRFPAVSPDGEFLAAVRSEAGVCRLLEIPLSRAGQADHERILAEADPFDMIVDPVYSPDGRWLVYVLGREGESELHRVDRNSGNTELLLKWPCIILSPVFHPGGRELVFSADPTGVYNLYRAPFRKNADADPLSHVLGGLFEPDFSPDGSRLAAASYDSHGYSLVVLDTGELAPIAEALPSVRREWPAVPHNQARLREAESLVPTHGPARRYRSLAQTRLDYWTPWALAVEEAWMGGIAAGFSDPAGLQSATLIGGYDGDLDAPVGSGVYTYSGRYPVFTAFGSYGADSYVDLVRDDEDNRYDYEETVGGGGLAVTIPWSRIDRDWALSLGFQYMDREALDPDDADYADRTLATTNLFAGAEASLFARLDFFNGTAYPRSHSVEDGRYVSAVVEWTDRSLGGDLDRVRAQGHWREYLPLPWGENHVLKLEGLYGAGSGDRTAQGFFGVGGIDDLLDGGPGLARTVTLRGYKPNTQVGRSVAKAGIAYRFPLRRIYRGMSATKPVYRQQVFGELFYEGAQARGDEPDGQPRNPWLNSTGAEVHYSLTLFRVLDIAPGLGLAYAADRDPSDERLQMYVSFKAAIDW